MYRILLLLCAAACLTVPASAQCNHLVVNPNTHLLDCNDGFFTASNASASSVPAVTSLTVTHNLNTLNIIPYCFVTTTGVPVAITSWSGQTLNAVTLNFSSTANVQCNVNGTGGTGAAGAQGIQGIPGAVGPSGSMAVPYTQAVVAQSSVTVTQATHLQGTLALATCFDNTGTPIAVNCNYARDGTGAMTFTFAPAFTGTIEIFGGTGTNLNVAAGVAVLGTGAISSATCATVVTVTATGVATTDVLTSSFNSDPTAVTGYIPATAGMLTIIAYPSANAVNFKVCNNTSGSVTPGAITLNWKVGR